VERQSRQRFRGARCRDPARTEGLWRKLLTPDIRSGRPTPKESSRGLAQPVPGMGVADDHVVPKLLEYDW
jgi:hypothetical protein